LQQRVLIASLAAVAVFASTVGVAPVLRAKDEKLKPEQVIARHLESIGSPEKLKEIKTRSIVGSGHVEFRVGGHADLKGDAILVSDGPSVRLALKLPSLDYPGEQFVFDGKDVVIGQISPGKRSPLGTYLFQNDGLFKDGLLFGSLTTSWAFLNTAARPLKLDLNGPKKVEGRSVYELRYVPKKGVSNVTAFFYFDSESFRHLGSEFKAEVVPTAVGNKITDSAETIRYSLKETFDDFKQIDGLTLPHAYKVDYSVDSPRGGFVGSWTFAFTQMIHNQPIDRQVFSVN
jgi:hypothetical protein